MKAYLLTYSQLCSPARAYTVLNATNAIKTWIAPFPYAAILVSDLGTQELGAILRQHLGNVWFLVTEINHQVVDGWLPGNLWKYVNDPAQASLRPLSLSSSAVNADALSTETRSAAY